MDNTKLSAPQQIAATHTLLDPVVKKTQLTGLAIAPESCSCYVIVHDRIDHGIIGIDYLQGKVLFYYASKRNLNNIALSQAADTAYTTDRDGGAIGILSLQDHKLTEVVTGGCPNALALSPDEAYAFVGTTEGRLLKLHLASCKIVSHCTFPQASLTDLLMVPNGRILFAADYHQNLLLIVDTAQLSTLQTVSLHDAPSCLSFDPVLQRIYCVCQRSRTLAVVAFTGEDSFSDVPQVDVISLPTRGVPGSLTVSPNAERVFVTITNPAGLGVYHVDTRNWYPTLPLPENPTNIQATIDSQYVLVTTNHYLVLIKTVYGFGTHPDS